MAQRDVASFKATKNSRYAANTSGLITASNSQDMFEDVADSFLNKTDHFIDEDSFASNSATKVPSQQSVKAYVDAQVSSGTINDTDIKYFEQFDWIFSYSGAVSTGQELALGWVNFFSGGSFNMNRDGVNTTENVIGAIEISTGTTSTGWSVLTKNSTQMKVGIASFKLRFRSAVDVLSDATDTYTVYLGFGDTTNGTEPTEGCYFKYTHSVNAGKWQAVTSNASVRTAVDTGITVDLLYSIFEIEINAAGTSVTYKINGATVATITTNIPSGFFGLDFIMTKSAGTTSRKYIMDWYDFLLTRSTAR